MRCDSCGAKVMEGASFCPSCGAPLVAKERKWESGTTPLMVIKPKFIPFLVFFSVLPLQLFFTVWGAGFFGGFSMFAIQALKLSLPRWLPFVFFGALFFFGIPLVVYFVKKRTYRKTEYRFYDSHLEYYEGFFNIEEKSIPYNRITEVGLRKGILQRMYGLGTIILATPATAVSASTSGRSGIKIADIENPDETYYKVKELIESRG